MTGFVLAFASMGAALAPKLNCQPRYYAAVEMRRARELQAATGRRILLLDFPRHRIMANELEGRHARPAVAYEMAIETFNFWVELKRAPISPAIERALREQIRSYQWNLAALGVNPVEMLREIRSRQ